MHSVATLLVTMLLILQASSARVVPADCLAIRIVSPDPKLNYALRIVKPDPKMHYAMRIERGLPSCKP